MGEQRVRVRPSGLAGSHHGQFGRATYAGKDSRGEDVYRVIFGAPGCEQSSKFRAGDWSLWDE